MFCGVATKFTGIDLKVLKKKKEYADCLVKVKVDKAVIGVSFFYKEYFKNRICKMKISD